MSDPASSLRERDRELSQLDDALDRARAGKGGTVVVEGAAGIGKTSLLRAAAARAEGLRALTAAGSERESSFPFGVVRQLLEPTLAASDADAAGWFEGAASQAREVFDPALVAQTSGDAFPKLYGLYWLVANLAREQPIVALVDDAQWSDELSLSFLAYLARRVDELPLLLVVGTRPVAEERNELLAELVTAHDTLVLAPAALSLDAVGAWIDERLGAQDERGFAAACHDATRGNPFLLSELLREIDAQNLPPTDATARAVGSLAPGGVSAALTRRLARLPAGSQELLEALAILGDGADPAMVGELAGQDPEAGISGLAALAATGLLDEGDRVAFAHPLVRSTVYQGIPAATRAALHARAAELLRGRGAHPEAVATQLLSTPPAGSSTNAATLRAAAALVSRLGGHMTAVAFLARALEEPPPPEDVPAVLAELGRSEARAAQLPEAIEHLTQAAAATHGPAEQASIALELGRARKYHGDVVGAVRGLESALAAARASAGEDVAELTELLEVELLVSAYVSVKARARLRAYREALVAPAGAPQTYIDAFVLCCLAVDRAAEGRPRHEAVDLAQRALSSGLFPTDPTVGPVYGLVLAAVTSLECDRLDLVDVAREAMLRGPRRAGAPTALVTATSMQALVDYRRGRLTDAAANARTAMDLDADLYGRNHLRTTLRAIAVLAAIDAGEPPAQLARLADEAFDATLNADTLAYNHALHARGRLLVAQGDVEAGLDQLMAAGRHQLSWGAINPAILPWRSDAALALMQLGRHDEAAHLAHEELALAERFGAPTATGIAQRTVAVTGPPDQRVAGLRRSVDTLRDSPAQLELARSLLELGRTLRVGGSPIDARPHLAEAQELAVRCGAQLLATEARDEARATGIRPRRVALTGVDALTPSERRVADHAAHGLSNRRIAQTLYISEKTVEFHLANVYAKLGIRNRRELPDPDELRS